MTMHKNNNDASGNYGIYQIIVEGKVFKIGKADLDRITKISGDPTRIHQQIRILSLKYTEKNIVFRYLRKLFNVPTKEAKMLEHFFLMEYYQANGIIPEGNQKSFKP